MRGTAYAIVDNHSEEVLFVSLSRANAEEIIMDLYEERALGRFNGLVNRIGEPVNEALKMAETCYWSFSIKEFVLI